MSLFSKKESYDNDIADDDMDPDQANNENLFSADYNDH